MGGLAFLLAAAISSLFAGVLLYRRGDMREALSLTLIFAYALMNSLIGIFDDVTKLSRRENAGLTPIQKLAFQLLSIVLFLLARWALLGADTTLYFSFGDITLGWVYYPITAFLLLGVVNCANLTDGIDGLCGSVSFGIGVSFFYISVALCPAVSFLSAILIGCAVGFLVFNLSPAKIFMGDTGSLFFGALAGAMAVSLENPLLLLFVCSVYILEGVSVVIQVLVYKLTKKRVFLMAPLHHHLERLGWSENRICIVAIILTILFSVPAYILYLP